MAESNHKLLARVSLTRRSTQVMESCASWRNRSTVGLFMIRGLRGGHGADRSELWLVDSKFG